MRGLKLRQIETFCEMARQGSLATTAERLSLTESAVSVSLHELEKQLGESLFDKQGRRLVLSDRGRELLPQALELLERADSFGDAGSTGRTQALAIGATRSIGPHLLPQLIDDFEKQLDTPPKRSSSKLQYELFIQNTGAVLARLKERSLDLALIEGDVLDPKLIKRPWLRDQLVIFCRARHPFLSKKVGIKNIQGAVWALREPSSGTREIFLRAMAPIQSSLNIEVETTDNPTLSAVVRNSDRLGCLSRRVIENELRSGKLVEIKAKDIAPGLEQRLIRTLWLVTHPERYQRALLTQFLGFAQQWSLDLSIETKFLARAANELGP
jgi:DNA-binding transcriptional LysR family regulator